MKNLKFILPFILIRSGMYCLQAEPIHYTYTYDDVGRLVEVDQVGYALLEYTYLRSGVSPEARRVWAEKHWRRAGSLAQRVTW